jgi:hypothetical protein
MSRVTVEQVKQIREPRECQNQADEERDPLLTEGENARKL